MKNKIHPLSPEKVSIKGMEILDRTSMMKEVSLLKLLVKSREKCFSVYSYVSFTRPGYARDADRFHFHRFQKDRFTVVFGKLWILLYDARKDSKTFGKLEVIQVDGGKFSVTEKKELPVYTITIPEGVFHGIKNPGPEWTCLANHPTAEYNPKDEGRVPFSEIPILSLGGKPFDWNIVSKK